ncbi:MAG: NTP transferase domain-containing protein, partial [Pseudomonadota bacterium]
MTDVHVVIPARLASTRLPRKTLMMLGEKPVVQHVWERAQGIGANSVTVATDSDEIATVCRGFGADCEITAATHASGTDRIAEVAARRGWADDIIVNVQGDEPFMPAAAIRQVVRLMEDATTDMATLSVPLADRQLMEDPNCV